MKIKLNDSANGHNDEKYEWLKKYFELNNVLNEEFEVVRYDQVDGFQVEVIGPGLKNMLLKIPEKYCILVSLKR